MFVRHLLERVGRAAPVDVWWWFTTDVGVELERRPCRDSDVSEVATVNFGRHCNKTQTDFKLHFNNLCTDMQIRSYL